MEKISFYMWCVMFCFPISYRQIWAPCLNARVKSPVPGCLRWRFLVRIAAPKALCVCFALICFLCTWSLVLAAVYLGFCHRPEFVHLLISELFWLRFPREAFLLPESFFSLHLCALIRSDGSYSIFVFPLSWH
jgi:hypothetical protein